MYIYYKIYYVLIDIGFHGGIKDKTGRLQSQSSLRIILVTNTVGINI